MKKLISILKVILKNDFSIFKINNDSHNKFKKYLLPMLLTLCVFYGFGYYSYMIADQLKPLHLTYIVLTIWILFVSVLTLFEGIYKSQGILFECKDNDLLMSLPINKRIILFSRVIKLILFQIIYDCLFMLPALAVYAYFETPGINYYLISLVLLIILPIIPTVIAALIGSIIKSIANNFNCKKVIQTILSIVFTLLIVYFSINIKKYSQSFLSNASSINDIIAGLYLPIKLYLNLINHFNIIDLLELLVINIAFLIIFVYLMSLTYYKVMQKENNQVKHHHKHYESKVNIPMIALIKKEMKRYLSSPMYIFNTIFGVVILIGMSIFTIFKPDTITDLFKSDGATLDFNIAYLAILLLLLCMTSITCAAISLEGKSFNLTKSLPVSIKDILLSKLFFSLLVIYPFVFVSDIIIFVVFKFNAFYILCTLLVSFFLPILIESFGLLVNLKFPKMKFTSDVEVVKQSLSTVIAIYGGLGIATILMITYGLLVDSLGNTVSLIITIMIMGIMTFISYEVLIKKGPKMFKKIAI